MKVGDVITYAPPRGKSPTPLVTHRIAWIGRTSDGRRLFQTKGDANRTADTWRFTLDHATQPRVDFAVPFAGRIVMALDDRHTRMLVIGIPALLVALFALVRLGRDVRRERRGGHVPAEAAR